MEYRNIPLSLAELRELRVSINPTRKSAKSSFSMLERFALVVTRFVGSMGFFLILLVWTIGWLCWNLFAPLEMRFDPAPAFVIWLFTSNIIQLVLLPLVMVGQNLEGKFAEHRAQADFEINKKAEREIEVIVSHLENQKEMLLELARKLDQKH